MTNTKLFLLIGTSLYLIPNLTSAQCVATQDCATLGYTETSCSGGSGVKCPFGNKWACFKSDSEVCQQYGFTLTCTGGQIGAGTPCNGKYAECTCPSGYEWNDSLQKCENTCTIGAFYYIDDTCSNDYTSDKKLLGIVIYEKSSSHNGWVMSHKPVATNIKWSTEEVDISGLPNYTSASSLTDIQASCTNTDIIEAQNNSNRYLAALESKNYKEGNKTWCLPSGGLLKNALTNSANISKFNAAVSKIKSSAGADTATLLGAIYNGREVIWSSSEYATFYVWSVSIDTSGSLNMTYLNKYGSNTHYSVRPVMAF